MNVSDVKVAVSHFLDLVVNGRGGERENIEALESALDMLAWMQQVVSPTEGVEVVAAPEQEYEKMRQIIAQQFPSFGEPGAQIKAAKRNGESKPGAGAVDDLATVACELYEVAWRFQNTSDEDAIHVFANGYKDHWRFHLRSLQWYLEARR